MKATVKKTVRGTVFRERADESIQFALNRSGEMEHRGTTNPLSSAKYNGYPLGCPLYFLPQTKEDKGFEGDSYKKSPAGTDG